MDATCCPADVAFPQDFQLLNDACEHLEHMVDELCTSAKLKRPRMRRKCARRDYLNLSKSKKRSAKKIRTGVRKQLQYIIRDIGFIADMIQNNGVKLSKKQANLLNTITTLYEQQLYMYENHTHSVEDRIVSLSQPWIRPIVRGKAHANTEFGAKLHISMVDGYAKIERLSFDAFNEATDFFAAVEGYRKEHGFYPARVLADKIYRNREIMVWCKGRNIQMTGPVLGRPPKNQDKRREARRQEYQDICDRNIVEGEFGVGKRSYGLNRIMAHLPETSFCVIGIALLCMNLAKSLRRLLRTFRVEIHLPVLEELSALVIHGAPVYKAALLRIPSHKHILCDRQILNGIELLMDHGDPQGSCVSGISDGDFFSVETDITTVRLDHSVQDLHQC